LSVFECKFFIVLYVLYCIVMVKCRRHSWFCSWRQYYKTTYASHR